MENSNRSWAPDEPMDAEVPAYARPSTSNHNHDYQDSSLYNDDDYGDDDRYQDDDRHQHDDHHHDDDHISDDEEGGVRIGDVYIPPAPIPAMSFNNNGPRFIMSHITNENFKSYAGVHALGPFHKNYNSIIGPNGSGKSNVIDSMLFVFGFRATMLRSKKISVLIHSSTEYPNMKSATVSVHFCKIIDGEGKDFTVVPGSEITVSRTVFRDSSSFYALNGRRVVFKEVAQMLRSNGIDLSHSRFLILQNEVENIALMKPKAKKDHETGMLEYLENIIGTDRFKVPIENLVSKVDEYTDRRKEKLNRVRMTEDAIEHLEQPMRDAVNLINLRNTMLRTRNKLLQIYIHNANKKIQTKEQELVVLQDNLEAVDGTLREVQEELERKRNVLREGTEKYDVLEQKKEELTEKLRSCKRNIVTTKADLTQNTKKRGNLVQLLEQERRKLIELELIPERNQREIQECEALVVRHTEQKRLVEEELHTVVASVRSETQTLQEQKDRLQAEQIGLKRRVDEANNRRQLVEAELKLYLSTETNEVKKLEKIKEDLAKAQAALDEKRPLQEQLSRTVPADETKMREIKTKLQEYKVREERILTEVRPLRMVVEASRQALQDETSYSVVHDTIMRASRAGTLPGVYGRLGDLGGIDRQYDAAISTCCPALDNIVVDNVDVGLMCINFLRDGNIGRGTFIAQCEQEKLRPVYAYRRTYPENVRRLFDLVHVTDPRIEPVFYYVLRETLVANDLDQATRIAYEGPRYRVVTLGGDVIERDGAMSGAGRPRRGKMGRTVRRDTTIDREALQYQEEHLERLEQRLAELRNRQSEHEEAFGVLHRSLRNDKIMLEKLNTEIRSLTQQVPIIQNHLREQEAVVAARRVDPERKAILENSLAAAQQELDVAKENAGEVDEAVQRVDAQISAIAGGRVKDLEKTVDHHVKNINKVNSEITKLRVAINTSIRNVTRSKDKIQQMEADLEETDRNLETLNNQKTEFNLQKTVFQQDLEQVEAEINDGTGDFTGLKEEIQTLLNQENAVKAARLELNNAVKKVEKIIQDSQDKAIIYERERQAIKLEIPGVEGVPEIGPIPPLSRHTAEELEGTDIDEMRAQIAELKDTIKDRMPNFQAIQDYKNRYERYVQQSEELAYVTNRRNHMKELYNQLKEKRKTEFMTGFNTIAAKLKETYQMITMGGDAELELVDPLDPFSEGISYSVRPLNKSWKEIINLSGGEKTLSSLALVFALHYYKPTPMYVMDEIDAALDFKNVSIISHYIKERTENAQFIVISLRNHMFETSDHIVGIFKPVECTESATITNKLPPDFNPMGIVE